MRSGYRNHAIHDVARRYTGRHGGPAPDGFLSEFIFHVSPNTDRQGSIDIRRLERLGRPRIQFHPAIERGFVNNEKGGRIIDAGCGAGDDTRWLQENGYDVVIGVDKNPSVIDLGYAFYRDKGTNHAFLVGDVLKIKPKIPFDYIHSGALFHAMGSIDEVNSFLEVSRGALKDGGVFFGHTLGSKKYVNDFTRLQLTPDQIKEAVEHSFRLEDFQMTSLRGSDIKFIAYYTAVPK